MMPRLQRKKRDTDSVQEHRLQPHRPAYLSDVRPATSRKMGLGRKIACCALGSMVCYAGYNFYTQYNQGSPIQSSPNQSVLALGEQTETKPGDPSQKSQNSAVPTKTDNISNAIQMIETSIPSTFKVQHHLTYALHTGASRAKVFHSFVQTHNSPGFKVVYKVWQKGERYVYLESTNVTPAFDPVLAMTPLSLGRGSDPRAFHWNGSSYCLTWVHSGSDWDHRIINLDSGQEFSLNHCVQGFRGKNWIPLVYKNELRVVHVVDPVLQWFVFDAHTGCEGPHVPVEKAAITQWRGGSNFVHFGDTSMISVGHQTVDGNTHHPYLLHIDMETNQISRVEMEQHDKMQGIFDPTHRGPIKVF